MADWFFLSYPKLDTGYITINAPEVIKHFKAKRLNEGAEIVLFDGEGRAFSARIEHLGPKEAEVFVLHRLEENSEPPVNITLFTGILKGDKMDQVVRQAVEIGAKSIVPVIMDRTVVKLSEGKRKDRQLRWENIAISASSQCCRSVVPDVALPQKFTRALSSLKALDLVLVPYEEEKHHGLFTFLSSINSPPSTVGLFTGPEGGFSPPEIEALKNLTGVYFISLGPRILRAETAPLAVLSVLLSVWGDLGSSS